MGETTGTKWVWHYKGFWPMVVKDCLLLAGAASALEKFIFPLRGADREKLKALGLWERYVDLGCGELGEEDLHRIWDLLERKK